MAKIIKLIYDRYENDIGFINDDSNIENEYIIINDINNKPIQNDRKINIYTWGS